MIFCPICADGEPQPIICRRCEDRSWPASSMAATIERRNR